MDVKLIRLLKVEEKLKSFFDKSLFLFFNSKKDTLHDKYIESLFFKMIEESEELNLQDFSLAQIEEYLEHLEMDFYLQETSYLLEDIFIDSLELEPKVRLFSQLKKRKLLLLNDKFLDANQKSFYYEELFRARLLDSFYDFHLHHNQENQDYFKIFFKLLYSFVGLEEVCDSAIHLESWFLNPYLLEDYLTYERQTIVTLFQQELQHLNRLEYFELQKFLNTISLSFYFSSIFFFLLKIMEKDDVEKIIQDSNIRYSDVILNFLYKVEGKTLRLKVIK